MRKIKIENVLYEVVTYEEYMAHPNLYPKNSTAIMCNGYALPIRNKNESNLVGIILYPNSNCMAYVNYPTTPEDMEECSLDKMLDYSQASSTAELLRTNDRVMEIESQILQSSDEIDTPIIRPDDYPELVAFKQAIALKKISLKSYASRQGEHYDNNRRRFLSTTPEKVDENGKKKKSIVSNIISLKRIREMAPGFDMKVSLVIEDAGPNVPNPMGKKIVVDITSSDAVERNEDCKD